MDEIRRAHLVAWARLSSLALLCLVGWVPLHAQVPPTTKPQARLRIEAYDSLSSRTWRQVAHLAVEPPVVIVEESPSSEPDVELLVRARATPDFRRFTVELHVVDNPRLHGLCGSPSAVVGIVANRELTGAMLHVAFKNFFRCIASKWTPSRGDS